MKHFLFFCRSFSSSCSCFFNISLFLIPARVYLIHHRVSYDRYLVNRNRTHRPRRRRRGRSTLLKPEARTYARADQTTNGRQARLSFSSNPRYDTTTNLVCKEISFYAGATGPWTIQPQVEAVSFDSNGSRSARSRAEPGCGSPSVTTRLGVR